MSRICTVFLINRGNALQQKVDVRLAAGPRTCVGPSTANADKNVCFRCQRQKLEFVHATGGSLSCDVSRTVKLDFFVGFLH